MRKKTRSSGTFGRISIARVGSSIAPIHDDGVKSNAPFSPRVGVIVTDGATACKASRSALVSGTASVVWYSRRLRRRICSISGFVELGVEVNGRGAIAEAFEV